METVWASLFVVLLFGVLTLNIFSLPANWVILALMAIWKLTMSAPDITWHFIALLGGLAVLGEIVEFVAQVKGAKKYGASGKGNLGGVIGAVLGAIVGAPILFGLGALAGALAGAYLGCLLFERLHGRVWIEARRAAMGAFWGKAFGLTFKVGIGATMVIMSVGRIFA